MLNYCPNCGKPDIKAITQTKYTCKSCGYDYWNNPKATVEVIFTKDNNALFSKRTFEPLKGKYDFPGGFIEYNETARDACVREVKEETGLDIDPDKLTIFDTYTAEYVPGVSVVDIIFLIWEFEGEPVAADDSAALEWKYLEFMNSDEFVPYYDGLYPRLKKYLDKEANKT